MKGGKLFPADSVIMATTATIGEHALLTVPSLANQRFALICDTSSITALYLVSGVETIRIVLVLPVLICRNLEK